MKRLALLLCTGAMVAGGIVAVRAQDAVVDPGLAARTNAGYGYKAVLERNGIVPSPEGVVAYLVRVKPVPETIKHIDALVRQLGAASYRERQAAQQELGTLGLLAQQAVRAAAQSPDPELSSRSQELLAKFEVSSQESVLLAALQILATAPPGSVTNRAAAGAVLDIVSLCGKRYLQRAAAQALVAVAGPEQRALLASAVAANQKPERRVAAMPALGKVLGEQGTKELYPYLGDADEKVRLAAARAVANSGGRESLAALVDLLSSADVDVRMDSVQALRSLTGKDLGYAAYAAAEKRETAVTAWRTWLAGEGQTAKLSFPLKDVWGASYLNGHTLFAYGYGNQPVEETDAEGKVVWSYKANGVWSAEKMANGNVLIAAYNDNKVIEVNPAGEAVWTSDRINCLSAKPLPDGNVLVADYSGSRAVEMRKDGKVVWQYALGVNCSDVQRLENGNTLVAGGKFVREVTPEGKVVWEWDEGSGQVFRAQRLANGNTLVTDYSQRRACELDPEKKVVWEFEELEIGDAFRLPDGNTLITSGRRFLEVTPEKKILWTKEGCKFGSVRR